MSEAKKVHQRINASSVKLRKRLMRFESNLLCFMNGFNLKQKNFSFNNLIHEVRYEKHLDFCCS